MKKVYLLPNLFTTASLFCGMLALTHVFQDQLTEACWLILASAILDMLDGRIARLTKTESAFGVNYDSLADLVAFGVAPAALLFAVLRDKIDVKMASGVATLFATCGALRLARFNVQRTREEKRSFTGLPIPAAAGMLVAAYLVYERNQKTLAGDWLANFLALLAAALACLMVSNIPYPSHKNLELERRKPFDYLVSIILATCVIYALYPFFVYLLFLTFLAYVGFGVGRSALKTYRRLAPARPLLEDEDPLPLGR